MAVSFSRVVPALYVSSNFDGVPGVLFNFRLFKVALRAFFTNWRKKPQLEASAAYRRL